MYICNNVHHYSCGVMCFLLIRHNDYFSIQMLMNVVMETVVAPKYVQILQEASIVDVKLDLN